MSLRLKFYAFLAVAFVLGLLRWRSGAVDHAVTTLSVERERARLDAALKAKQAKEEVDALDDMGLANRASRWLRESGRPGE